MQFLIIISIHLFFSKQITPVKIKYMFYIETFFKKIYNRYVVKEAV